MRNSKAYSLCASPNFITPSSVQSGSDLDAPTSQVELVDRFLTSSETIALPRSFNLLMRFLAGLSCFDPSPEAVRLGRAVAPSEVDHRASDRQRKQRSVSMRRVSIGESFRQRVTAVTTRSDRVDWSSIASPPKRAIGFPPMKPSKPKTEGTLRCIRMLRH